MHRSHTSLCLTAMALLVPAAITSAQLANCTEDFDITCPDVNPQCGATFVSSSPLDTCFSAGLLFCYSSGLNGYQVSPGQTVTITLSDDLFGVRVFFAQSGNGAGTMEFFDGGGQPVGVPLTPNGNCGLAMPPLQEQCSDTAVRSIVVTNTSVSGQLWLDDFEVNPTACPPPAAIPTVSQWGLLILCVLLVGAGGIVLGRRKSAAA